MTTARLALVAPLLLLCCSIIGVVNSWDSTLHTTDSAVVTLEDGNYTSIISAKSSESWLVEFYAPVCTFLCFPFLI
jgi:hypothetical protein